MRRYELVEDGKTYFWEIAISRDVENLFVTREGLDGNVTRSRDWDFRSADRMRAEYRKHLDWRERAGFNVVHSDPEDDVIVKTWLAELRTDVNLEIEARIAENPDDPDAYLVYGDWLESRGSARGELVQVQAARLKSPNDFELREREGTLLAEYERPWLGELADATTASLEWRFGFLHEVTIHCLFRELAAQYRMLTPLTVARLLRHLRIKTWTYELDEGLAIDVAEFFGAEPALEARPVRLSRLDLECPDAAVAIGDLPPSLGQLTRLMVAGDVVCLKDVSLETLAEIDLSFAELEVEGVMNLPKLESLSLTMIPGSRARRGSGERSLGSDAPPFIIRLVQQAAATMALLRVRVPSWGDDVVRSLARLESARSLSVLDLSGSGLTDAGAGLLVMNAAKNDAFERIGRLDLRFNRLSGTMCETLTRTFGESRVTVDEQDERAPWLRGEEW